MLSAITLLTSARAILSPLSSYVQYNTFACLPVEDESCLDLQYSNTDYLQAISYACEALKDKAKESNGLPLSAFEDENPFACLDFEDDEEESSANEVGCSGTCSELDFLTVDTESNVKVHNRYEYDLLIQEACEAVKCTESEQINEGPCKSIDCLQTASDDDRTWETVYRKKCGRKVLRKQEKRAIPPLSSSECGNPFSVFFIEGAMDEDGETIKFCEAPTLSEDFVNGYGNLSAEANYRRNDLLDEEGPEQTECLSPCLVPVNLISDLGNKLDNQLECLSPCLMPVKPKFRHYNEADSPYGNQL